MLLIDRLSLHQIHVPLTTFPRWTFCVFVRRCVVRRRTHGTSLACVAALLKHFLFPQIEKVARIGVITQSGFFVVPELIEHVELRRSVTFIVQIRERIWQRLSGKCVLVDYVAAFESFKLVVFQTC